MGHTSCEPDSERNAGIDRSESLWHRRCRESCARSEHGTGNPSRFEKRDPGFNKRQRWWLWASNGALDSIASFRIDGKFFELPFARVWGRRQQQQCLDRCCDMLFYPGELPGYIHARTRNRHVQAYSWRAGSLMRNSLHVPERQEFFNPLSTKAT